MADPCTACKRRANCPRPCYTKKDYIRGAGKRRGKKAKAEYEAIRQFVKDRNEAFFSLDYGTIVRFLDKYGMERPKNIRVFWAGVYKAVLAINDTPEEVREKARQWLDENGFSRKIKF